MKDRDVAAHGSATPAPDVPGANSAETLGEGGDRPPASVAPRYTTGRRIRHRSIRARTRFYYERDKVKWKARSRVHYEVKMGRLPRVSTLSCTDCGGPACDYDHWRGYAGDAAIDVQPVCRPCHLKRGGHRGEHPERVTRGRRELIRDWAIGHRWLSHKAERLHGYDWGVPNWDELWVSEIGSSPVAEYDYHLEEMAHVAMADAVSGTAEAIDPVRDLSSARESHRGQRSASEPTKKRQRLAARLRPRRKLDNLELG